MLSVDITVSISCILVLKPILLFDLKHMFVVDCCWLSPMGRVVNFIDWVWKYCLLYKHWVLDQKTVWSLKTLCLTKHQLQNVNFVLEFIFYF